MRWLPKLAVCLILALPLVAAAASIEVPAYGTSTNLSGTARDAGNKVAQLVMAITGVLGVLAVMVGGAAFIAKRPDVGRQIIAFALVGLVVVESAAGIAMLVL